MHVVKRDGSMQPADLAQIQNRIAALAGDLHVDASLVAQKTIASLVNGMATSELDGIAAKVCMELFTTQSDYERLATRLTVANLHRENQLSFSANVKSLHAANRVTAEFMEFVMENSSVLDVIAEEARDRDYDLTFFGLTTLVSNKYLLQFENGVFELPCFMYLRVAIAICQPSTTFLLQIFTALSKQEFTFGTPTLFNAGTKHSQFASCFLMQLQDDSVEGIYATLSQAAKISKHAGGIGLHMHNLRSRDSLIRSTGCKSQGLMPVLRVFNESSRLVHQSGKRPGSIAVYLAIDHADVIDFIDMRKNHGDEDLRCRELFSGLWVCDKFMQAVQSDKMWHLFSPDTAPFLNDVYGAAYDTLYDKYVEEKRYVKEVPARELWLKLIHAQVETGTPYMLYKDAINRHSNQKNVGVVKSSNLCTEIVEVSNADNVAVCNLASLCLSKMVKRSQIDLEIDFEKIDTTVRLMVRSLDHIIDRTFYPLPEARRSNLHTRPLGIGVQGLQTLFYRLRVPFDSLKARHMNKQIFAQIFYSAWDESADLAATFGPYPAFSDSPLASGVLHCDTFAAELPTLDWSALRVKVRQGVRHSMLTCVMPTASTSQICGNTESIEPMASNLYVRRTLAGEFVCLNQWLVRDLEARHLWSETMKLQLIAAEGSIQSIDAIPDDIKKLYKTCYDLSQRVLIDLAADRQPFIDQSQSLNLFLEDPKVDNVSAMLLYGWKKGLKTGLYYLKTRPKAAAAKFVVPAQTASQICTRECEACSA